MQDGIVRTLTSVRHVPELKKNLISLGTFDSQGCKFFAQGVVLKLSKGTLMMIKGKLMNGLYLLQGSTVVGAAFVSSSSDSDLETARLWHMRLGYMSETWMSILSKHGLLDGIKIGKLDFCEHCVYGKQTRVKFITAIHKTNGTIDYIHYDLWGPALVPLKGGARYLLTFIDDFSRKVQVYFLKHKNDVFPTFKKWKAMIENQTGKKIKRLRMDNDMEFYGSQFNEFCENESIVRHRTVPHTPQQNGVT